MLFYSLAKDSLTAIVKKKTTKTSAILAIFSKEKCDVVTFVQGQKTLVEIDLSTDYHKNFDTREWASTVDGLLAQGPYSPDVLSKAGFISEETFEKIAKALLTQEAYNRELELPEEFDYARTLKGLISRREFSPNKALLSAK